MQKTADKTILIISAVLGVAALILIVLSIVGEFATNWVLTAGLGCAALGSLIQIMNGIRNRKSQGS